MKALRMVSLACILGENILVVCVCSKDKSDDFGVN